MIILGIEPDYFLDKMSFDEVIALLKAAEREKKESWEKVRQICFHSIAPYSKKLNSAMDVFPLPWDKKNKPKILTAEEKESKKRIAQKIIKKING